MIDLTVTGVAHLSFQRAPRLSKVMPAAPTNADRLRMLRIELAKRTEVGNDYAWPFNGSQSGGDPLAVPRTPVGCQLSQGERYALDQMMDGPPTVIPYAAYRGI